MINLRKEDNIFLGYSRIDGRPVYKYLRGNVPLGAIRVYNEKDEKSLYFKMDTITKFIDKNQFINFFEYQ